MDQRAWRIEVLPSLTVTATFEKRRPSVIVLGTPFVHHLFTRSSESTHIPTIWLCFTFHGEGFTTRYDYNFIVSSDLAAITQPYKIGDHSLSFKQQTSQT